NQRSKIPLVPLLPPFLVLKVFSRSAKLMFYNHLSHPKKVFHVPAYTCRQLKEDKFAKGTQEAVHWATEHRQLLIMAIGTILVVGIAVTVFLAWTSHQSERANLGYGKALRTSVAPIRPPNTPADPAMKSFTSMAERAREAEKE